MGSCHQLGRPPSTKVIQNGLPLDDFARILRGRDDQLLQIQDILGAVAQRQTRVRGRDAILRNLTSSEIQVLKDHCRCRCKDWNHIFLLVPTQSQALDYSQELRSLVSDTTFDGFIILSLIDETIDTSHIKNDWYRLPPGLHSNSLVCDSIFHLRSCRVYRNTLLSSTHVGAGSVVANCGHVSASKDNTYGGLSLSVGAESGGGRKLNLSSQDTMIEVCQQLRKGPRSITRSSQGPGINVIGNMCIIRDTPTIHNVYLHDHSAIEAATSVSNATLFPQSSIKDASTATNVLLQWDASITGNSTVTETILMEQAHCGPSSIVASCVLGPDVHVSAGEVHASVIGPNTNAHHQSLLIGVLWPLGRGNVGYGANVGSNHTGRLPDQETTAGEGTFWGLSNVIKFPVDLTFAPYSLVAAGTTLPPQRICMPFSLIVEQPNGNEIIPGWVLQSSPYTIVRSEKKYATRRKAKRHDSYTGWKILRPDTIALCRWAKMFLEATNDESNPAFGSNKLTERARTVGIQAYQDAIQRYALHGLLAYLLEVTEGGKHPLDTHMVQAELAKSSPLDLVVVDPLARVDWPTFPWESPHKDPWPYQRALVLECYPLTDNITSWMEDLFAKLLTLETDFVRRIQKSKNRDDKRGQETIPGYTVSHVTAANDPVVVESIATSKRVESDVAKLKSLLHGTRSRL